MKQLTEDGEIIDTICEDCAPVFFKTPWNYDRNAESDRTGLKCEDPTLTQQHLAKETELSFILGQFLNTGQATGLPGNPVFADLPESNDLADHIVTGYEVEQAWNRLPSAVRNILKDPSTFVEYVDHCMATGDLDPLRELGLANAKPPQQAITPGGAAPPPPSPERPPSGLTTPSTEGST